MTEPFSAKLFTHALVDRDTGKVEAYASGIDEANELGKRFKNAEAKLFREPKPLSALPTFEEARVLPPFVGDAAISVTASRDRSTFEVWAPPGTLVIVKNAVSKDTVGRVDVPYIPASSRPVPMPQSGEMVKP